MPALNVTEEQIVTLLDQLTLEQRTRVLNRFAVAANTNGASGSDAEAPVVERPRPRFGSAKNVITYMADDFDAPLDDMKEYME